MAEKQFAAGGVVVRKEGDSIKVLLIKDSYGHWTWPKGHIEEGETPQEAALREVAEETGVNRTEIIEKIGTQEYNFMFGDTKTFKTVHIFLIEDKGDGELVPQAEEISLAEWFTPEEALEKIEYEGSRDKLEKAIKIYKEKGKRKK